MRGAHKKDYYILESILEFPCLWNLPFESHVFDTPNEHMVYRAMLLLKVSVRSVVGVGVLSKCLSTRKGYCREQACDSVFSQSHSSNSDSSQ